jgi:hypothetical protein
VSDPGTLALQAPEVLGRSVESVGVVDAESGDPPGPDETKDEPMSLGEDVRVLHADGRELIDVEEASVVDLLPGHPPKCDPVSLLGQQLVEEVEGSRILGRPVEAADGLVKERLDLG